MDREEIKLHWNRKKTLIITVLFTIFLCLTNTLLMFATQDSSFQMTAVLNSKYSFSAISQEEITKDSYYRLNAGINFSISKEFEQCINAEVVMQPEIQNYTETVYWNSEKLAKNEIAVSENIVRSCGLDVGVMLYSKNVVNGEVEKYEIRQILPSASWVRVTNEMIPSSGIIIMGFDKNYVDNITHETLFFANESVEKALENICFSGVVYRDDELKILLRQLLPYLIMNTAFAILSSSVFVFSLTKEVSCNMSRQIVLGFSSVTINQAYYKYSRGIGMIAIIVAFLINMILIILMGQNIVRHGVNVFMFILELVMLFVMSKKTNEKLWKGKRI